ncbi:MAG: hypothetical protein Q7J59_05605 [Elusimicrobiota bacterium]|nr:hypothetical protein [Elusimicrobiota bacterium]
MLNRCVKSQLCLLMPAAALFLIQPTGAAWMAPDNLRNKITELTGNFLGSIK